MKNYTEKEDEVKKTIIKKRKLSDDNQLNSIQSSKRKHENQDIIMGYNDEEIDINALQGEK